MSKAINKFQRAFASTLESATISRDLLTAGTRSIDIQMRWKQEIFMFSLTFTFCNHFQVDMLCGCINCLFSNERIRFQSRMWENALTQFDHSRRAFHLWHSELEHSLAIFTESKRWVFSHTVHYIPKLFDFLARTLVCLQINKIKLQSNDRNDLRQFPKIRMLSLQGNNLQWLDGNLFSSTRVDQLQQQ